METSRRLSMGGPEWDTMEDFLRGCSPEQRDRVITRPIGDWFDHHPDGADYSGDACLVSVALALRGKYGLLRAPHRAPRAANAFA